MENLKVAAIMVTSGSPWRRKLAQVAIRSFLDQSHKHRRLFIVDHNQTPVYTGFGTPLWGSDLIHHVWVEKETLGGLRNVGLRLAREWGADYAMPWDDDDWSHPMRMKTQLIDATKRGPGFASILQGYVNYDLLQDRMWYRDQSRLEFRGAPGLILFPLTAELKYQERDRHEDSHFCRTFKEKGKLVAGGGCGFYVRSGHHDNASGSAHVLTRWVIDRQLKAHENEELTAARELYRSAGCLGPQAHVEAKESPGA